MIKMGSGTEGEKKAKRLYSLAYNRALAELKDRYPEEFQTLLGRAKFDVILEDEVLGAPRASSRGGVKHTRGEDGNCVWCGRVSPCYEERRRTGWRKRRDGEEAAASQGGGEGL